MDNIPEPQSKYSTGKAYFSFICVSGWTNQNLLPDTTDPLCDGSLLHLLTLRWSLGQILGFESTLNCICDPQGHINHWHEGCWITFRRERCLKIECTWATVPLRRTKRGQLFDFDFVSELTGSIPTGYGPLKTPVTLGSRVRNLFP